MAAVTVPQLIEEHYESLYRYAYRLSGSASDADDLTQQTFGKVLTRLDQLREVEKARGWLFRILRNEYLHAKRDEKQGKAIPLESIGELPGREEHLPPDIDPANLQDALNALDEAFRTPLILYYFDDLSYRDIAEQLDVPIGTVMSRLARGKKYLKDRLTRSDGSTA